MFVFFEITAFRFRLSIVPVLMIPVSLSFRYYLCNTNIIYVIQKKSFLDKIKKQTGCSIFLQL